MKVRRSGTALGADGLFLLFEFRPQRFAVTGKLAVELIQSFVITGGDSRVSGVGAISLVAGSMSNRGVSGPNANRGWLNMTIGSPLGALPSMSGPGIAALVGLMSLAGGYAMRQRNRK